MQGSTASKSYRGWRAAVDDRLDQLYHITIADSGMDEEYLVEHWSSNEASFEFVEWFGQKYDLDRDTKAYANLERGR
jgi:hypothetical protein